MPRSERVLIPDIGEFTDVEVIEVLVAPGDRVEVEQSLVTLESDKATMEIPAPVAGTVRELHVGVGDKVSEGTPVATIETDANAADAEAAAAAREKASETAADAAHDSAHEKPDATASEKDASEPAPESGPAQMLSGAPPLATAPSPDAAKAHASPSVRRFARELGVDLRRVAGSGRKGRIVKADIEGYVKTALATQQVPREPAGFAVPRMPAVDFSKWGEIEIQPLAKLRRTSARNLHRAWLGVPHVTQFDEADITELEEFRLSKQREAADKGLKLTLLGFFLKAVAVVLDDFPTFNSSLDETGEALILKRYVHIGVAVDTDQGLVVPVIRNVDRKGLYDLASELAELSQRARDRKLGPADLQGGTFTISSLGGIGGTAFTPIVNAPEVAILGVAKARMQPVWDRDREEFRPRLLCPLCLSYDHRVIDGADAARFTTRLAAVLGDIRNLIL